MTITKVLFYVFYNYYLLVSSETDKKQQISLKTMNQSYRIPHLLINQYLLDNIRVFKTLLYIFSVTVNNEIYIHYTVESRIPKEQNFDGFVILRVEQRFARMLHITELFFYILFLQIWQSPYQRSVDEIQTKG